jgi:phenylpropionate dioxygenase-like ring-hydroxylating dioxygenase large terminal subunit
MAHPALQDLYGRTYRDIAYSNGMSKSIAEFGDQPGRLWSVRNYLKITPEQDWLPEKLRKAWTYYGVFPNGVITFTPESAGYYQDIPVSPTETLLTGRLYRRANETREMRAARYLAMRIDRETAQEDQQLSIWSNEAMKSSAFDRFHLSDLEYGVRNHHDQLRTVLPVVTEEEEPGGDTLQQYANETLSTAENPN